MSQHIRIMTLDPLLPSKYAFLCCKLVTGLQRVNIAFDGASKRSCQQESSKLTMPPPSKPRFRPTTLLYRAHHRRHAFMGCCFRQTLAFVIVSIVTTAPTIRSQSTGGGGGGGERRRSAEGHVPCVSRSIPSVCSSADTSVITDALSACAFAARVTTPSTSCSINRTISGAMVPPTSRC